MSVPVSTLPTVKAWLLGQLQSQVTAAAGKSLAVFYDDAAITEPEDEIRLRTGKRSVVPGSITGGMGAHSWREEYDLNVDVMVSRPEGFQVAEERAWAILATVESIVRVTLWGLIAGDTTVRAAALGGDVFNVIVGEHTTAIEWPQEFQGPLVIISYPITISAEL